MPEQTSTFPRRWDRPNFKHQAVTPRVLEKSRKATEHDTKLAKAYAAVNERERNVCQVSGVELQASSANPKRRREHHHLRGRNVKPEWIYEPKRIALVSAAIHQLLTDKVILCESTDATKPLKLRWNRAMVKNKPPMRLEKVR